MLHSSFIYFYLFLITIFGVPYDCSSIKTDISGEEIKWDILIFTQQWPITYCYDWMEHSEHNECTLPKEKTWTIHGIWPNRNETVGPFYCNRTWHFDINKIKPIEAQLELYWTNIEKGDSTDLLWQHEWEKHGTCAAELLALNSEKKYFNQGLEWFEKYSMTTLLNNVDIKPDNQYTVFEIYNSLINLLIKRPVIHCYYDNRHNISYLSEIRLCFDKNLNLIDCENIIGETLTIDSPGGKIITNCDVHSSIIYPLNVPPTKYDYNKNYRKLSMVNFYKLLQLIKWLTL